MGARAVLTVLVAAAVCAQAAVPADSSGDPPASASLHVSLDPDTEGSSTTMDFGFRIAAAGGTLPPALTGMDVQLPAGMIVHTTGLAACGRGALEAQGPRACSSNANVGRGSVEVRVPLGDVVRTEDAQLSVFNAPPSNGRARLLFYAVGRIPIATQLIFAGVILPGARGESIDATIPLIPTLPNSPDAAIVSLDSTLGTLQHAYYRTLRGRQVRLKPPGVTVPRRCPGAGLSFSATFRLNDGSRVSASDGTGCAR